MIFIFQIILSSFLLAQNQRSIVWVSNSESDIKEILNFKKEKKDNFNFTLVSDVFKDTGTDIELADYLNIEYPFFIVFYPSQSGIEKIKNYPSSPIVFKHFIKYFFEGNKFRGNGFFSRYPQIDKDNYYVFKDLGYKWVYGGISSASTSGYSDMDGLKTVYLEVLRSTYDFYSSSGSFFIIDDVKNGSSSVNILKEIFSNNNFNFLSVSSAAYVICQSTSVLTDNKYIFKCERQQNYISYLSLITSQFDNACDIDSDFIQSYLPLFDYYHNLCDDETDFSDDIRRITRQLYEKCQKDLPSFVYYDFLNNSYVRKYQKIVSSSSLSFISNSDELIKEFSIVKDNEKYRFSIEFSTDDIKGLEVHIYVDINKRRNAGSDSIINHNEKIDSLYSWEYSFVSNLKNVVFYKSGYRDYLRVGVYKVKLEKNILSFDLKQELLPGNIFKWNYIIVVYGGSNKLDGIFEMSENKFLAPID